MSSREMLLETRFEWALGHRADDLVDELAALEEQERRDPHDHELLRDPRVLVRVELHERHLPRIGLRELVDHRGDCAARRAPLGPEVDDDVGMFLDHLVEVGIGDMDGRVRAGDFHLLVRHGWHLVLLRRRFHINLSAPRRRKPPANWGRHRPRRSGECAAVRTARLSYASAWSDLCLPIRGGGWPSGTTPNRATREISGTGLSSTRRSCGSSGTSVDFMFSTWDVGTDTFRGGSRRAGRRSSRSMHRPLSWYGRVLRGAGLLIRSLEEAWPTQEFVEASPQGPYVAEIPLHLIFEAIKV